MSGPTMTSSAAAGSGSHALNDGGEPREPCHFRPLCGDDLELLTQWLANPDIQRVFEDEPGGFDASRRKVQALIGMDPVIDRQCGYLVFYEQRPIGFIHLKEINWIGRTGEIDILVEPASQRSLLGLWVVAKTAEICFDMLNLRKAYGYIFANNTPSSRFFSRLLQHEATLSPGRRPASGDEDVLILSLTVEHYRALRSRYRWDDFIKGRGTRP